jgi:hypothetical protein
MQLLGSLAYECSGPTYLCCFQRQPRCPLPHLHALCCGMLLPLYKLLVDGRLVDPDGPASRRGRNLSPDQAANLRFAHLEVLTSSRLVMTSSDIPNLS